MAKPLRIGVAGLGSVGAALVRLLQRRRADLVGAHRARHRGRRGQRARRRERGLRLDGVAFYDDRVALAASGDIDLFVELIGGADGAAYDGGAGGAVARVCRSSPPTRRCSPPTAWNSAELAEAHGAPLAFEAAVGGGIPIIKTLREGLAGNAVRRVSGILNGTCNYILSRMETDGLPFDALPRRRAEARLRRSRSDLRRRRLRHRAQARHPRLARLRGEDRRQGGFGRGHRDRSRSPISPPPTNSAIASSCSASPSAPPRASSSASIRRWSPNPQPLAQTMGVLNAVTIDGDAIGALTLVGPGAGGEATASAVAADIADIARGDAPRLRPAGRRARGRRARADAAPRGRLLRSPRRGRAAGLGRRPSPPAWPSTHLARSDHAEGQARRDESEDVVPVVLLTHATTETAIREALALALPTARCARSRR